MMAAAHERRHVPPTELTGATTEIIREQLRLDGLSVAAARPARESGAPVLFIHGLFAAGWMFDRWMTYFADRGRAAYALDLRAHGASAPVADLGRVSLADYVDDALRAARALGDVVLVGHSMGGLIAQKLAERGAVSAAVLVSPAPPRGISPISVRLLVRQARYLPALLRSREIRVRRADADAIIMNRIPPDERGAVFARFQPDSGRAARDMMLGAVGVDPRRVRCPVVVVAGDDDRFIPLRVARRVAATYNAPLRVLLGRAHLVMREPRWREAAGEVESWLVSL
jgi:pimeloyl-ACP methyl ester carboxylesterase